MTPAQAIHDAVQSPLQHCYQQLHKGGRFLSRKQTAQLSMLDRDGRDRLIAQIVTRMRKGRRA